MTGICIDYSWTHPDPAAIAAAEGVITASPLVKAPVTGVIRYLSTDPTKNLSVEEAAALHAAGLGIILIWETTADRALDGAAAGAADGALAVAQAQALGFPAGCHLLVNLGDFNTNDNIAAIQAYYYDFRRVAGFDYGYGGYATGYKIDKLVEAGAIGLWWQNAMNDGGQLGSTISANASIYQRVSPTTAIAGGGYDENVYDFGPDQVNWWLPESSPTPTPPAPAPEPAPSPPPAPTLQSVTVVLSDGTTQTWAA